MLALGFMGLMVQSNSIAESFSNAFGIPSDYTGIIGLALIVLCTLVFLGGVKRLAAITEKLVPIMAIAFLICGFIILCCRIRYIPETFAMIFKYAFNPNAILGCGVGMALKTAISEGAKRGLFSNEAGMGSTPHAHAMASVEHPHQQGVVAMIGVFIDTFMVLTMTALVLISTLYCGGNIDPMSGVINKTNAMQTAVSTVFGDVIGSVFVAICLFFFAFSTIICWNFFGRLNAQYLFKNNKNFMIIYSLISIFCVFLGTVLSNDFVWELTDLFNNLMVIPNVIALIALSRLVVDETKEARKRKKEARK